MQVTCKSKNKTQEKAITRVVMPAMKQPSRLSIQQQPRTGTMDKSTRLWRAYQYAIKIEDVMQRQCK